MTPLKETYTGGIEVTWWVMASTALPTDLPRAVRPVWIAWSSSDPSLATWHADVQCASAFARHLEVSGTSWHTIKLHRWQSFWPVSRSRVGL